MYPNRTKSCILYFNFQLNLIFSHRNSPRVAPGYKVMYFEPFLYKRLSGLGVWFLLWVQEVPGSNPGWAHSFSTFFSLFILLFKFEMTRCTYFDWKINSLLELFLLVRRGYMTLGKYYIVLLSFWTDFIHLSYLVNKKISGVCKYLAQTFRKVWKSGGVVASIKMVGIIYPHWLR